MAHLVVGDVMNVLGEIAIDFPQFLGVDWISAAPWLFAVPDSAQFVILGVTVTLDGFSRSQEPQDAGISCREAAGFRPWLCSAQPQVRPHGVPGPRSSS